MDNVLFDNFKYIIATMLSPLWITLLIQGLAILLWCRGKSPAALKVFLISFLFLLLGSLSGWTYEARRQAEFVYAPFQLDVNVDKLSAPLVVVLGTGFNSDPELPFTSQVSGTFLARLLEGVRIQRHFADSKILISIAGRADPEKKQRFYQQMIELLQIDPSRAELLTTAKSTEDEALLTKEYYTGQPVIVVTSAGHIVRAMKTFETAGLTPLAAPTDYGFPRSGSPDEKIWQRWLPSTDGLGSNHQWLYEKVAMLWQQIKSRRKQEV